MKRLRKTVPISVLLAFFVTGCGGEIARIDGLPETRDVSDVPWPRLLDTPTPPTDSLLPAQGQRTLALLNEAQDTVLIRAAQPGPQRVAVAELDGRVARIKQQAAVVLPGVDEAALAARAARLLQVRAVPVVAVPEAELQARAQRIAAARAQAEAGIDAEELRNRAQRTVAAQARERSGLDSATLAARANRVTAGSQGYYAGLVDRNDLAQRSQRIETVTRSPSSSTPTELVARKERAAVTRITPPSVPDPSVLAAKRDEAVARRARAVPKPIKTPVASRPEREKPVISDSFRKRAEEARKRALERAKETTGE